MKKQYLIAEFATVFLFLVVPPLFVSNGNSSSNSFSFSTVIFAEAVVAFLLDFQFHYLNKNKDEHCEKKIISFAKYSSIFFITFGSLVLVFALFQLLSFLFPKITVGSLSSVILPCGFYEWCACVFMLLVGAYYEEVVYRFFVPENLYLIFGKSKNQKIIIELTAILLFAFSHMYLGFIAVINAAICGAILRFCFVKTKSVYTGAFAHFLYNLGMYILFTFA
ncbi:MAG: type II CAAX endopeptidase family protein [Treponema sp.]